MNIGNIAAREKLTGRLFFQRPGSPQVDLGNVLLVKQEPKLDRTSQLSAQKGFFQVTHEEIGKVDPRWSFKCDERSGPALRLLNLAKETDVSQAAGGNNKDLTSSLSLTLDGTMVYVPAGKVINLGIVNLTNLELDFPTPLFTWGGGWVQNGISVDPNAGTITFTQDTYAPVGTRLTAEYACNAATIKQYTVLSEAFVRGVATIYLEDQNDVGPKKIISFPAEIQTSERGEDDGQKFSDFTLQLLAIGPASVQARE